MRISADQPCAVRDVAASHTASQLASSLLALIRDKRVVARAVRVYGEHVTRPAVEVRVEHDLDVVLAVQHSISLASECHQADSGRIIRLDSEHDRVAGRDDADDRPRARCSALRRLDLSERRDRVDRLPHWLSKLAVQMDRLRHTNTNGSTFGRSVALGTHGGDTGEEERDGAQRALTLGHPHELVTSEVGLLQLMTENQ